MLFGGVDIVWLDLFDFHFNVVSLVVIADLHMLSLCTFSIVNFWLFLVFH